METRSFGGAGVAVPVIGQGTWMMGERARNEKAEIEALKTGLDLGMTHIDTAEMYGSGGAERLVAKAIRGRRDEVFLASKVLPSNASYDGTLRSCEASLGRLETDHLDLYMLHWASGPNPIEETMRAMRKLIDDGKIRFAGVSNLTVDQMDMAREALGDRALAANQVLYHLRSRGIEVHFIAECERRGVAVVAYSPFGQGNFPAPYSSEGQRLEEIGSRYGKTARQVALNFLTRHPNVFTIPKSAVKEHVIENAGAIGWEISPEDVRAIDDLFPAPRKEPPLDML